MPKDIFMTLALTGIVTSPLAAMTAFAAESTTMQLGYFAFPPFSMEGKDYAEHGKGYFLDMMEKGLQTIDVKMELREYPIARAKEYLSAGKVDVYLCSAFQMDEKMKEQFVLSKTILSVKPNIFQNAAEPSVEAGAKLENAKIVALTGIDGFLKSLPQSNKIERVPDMKAAARLFANDRTKYDVDYRERMQPLVDGFITEFKSPVKYRTVELAKVGLNLCWNKKFSKAAEWSDKMRDFAVAFQDTAEGKALAEKYKLNARWGE